MAHEKMTEQMTKSQSMMGMGNMMGEMGPKSMMGMMGEMGEMMEMCPMMMGMEMGPMMMGNPAGPMKPAAAIAVVTAGANPGKSLFKRLARNPWVWFGLGVVAGILIHRYRKEIIATAVKVGEKSKDFVLQQKESLEDIVAESQEK